MHHYIYYLFSFFNLQKGCKTDSSLFNSTLTKFPPAPHQKADFAEIMQLKIQKLEEENGFLRQDVSNAEIISIKI